MSNPRTVNNTGARESGITYKIDNSTITFDATKTGGSAQVGLAVTFSGNDTVALVGDNERVVGKLAQVYADNTCTVIDQGFVTLPAGSGATVTAGKRIVGDLGPSSAKGYIQNAPDFGAAYAEATADAQVAAAHLITNAATATAVVVRLDS